MGSLRLTGWASAQRGYPAAAAPEWGVRRRPHRCCYGVPLPRPRCAPSPAPAVASSLGVGAAGHLRTGAEHEWLWDCRGARDYAREMEVAVRVVQVACTLCQRVQDSLLHPSADAGGCVHSKLDRSPVTVAGSYLLLIHQFPFPSRSTHSIMRNYIELRTRNED
jgi:3'(2'), 5'-bisphosphate nucleotidase